MLRQLVFLFLITAPFVLSAESSNSGYDLHFIQKEGQILHADSLVDESVYINGSLSHQAEIEEFSVSAVRELRDDGVAQLDSSFRTVERIGALPGILEWVSAETVQLKRDSKGVMTVPDEASRPVLRGVPRFPDHPVNPGDSWSLPAEEVHVFRIGNYLYGPYRGPVQVLYHYLENSEINGRMMANLKIEYNVYLPVRSNKEPIRLISGRSSQELLWDIELGRPELKSENFEFMMVMADGRTQEFVGSGKTSYRYTMSIDRPRTVESLQSELETLPGLTIEEAEEGVLLSVTERENILFEPESARITEEQRYLLEELSRSLQAYAERDILITGHTADYGTAEGRKALSFERAAAVADILFPEGRTGPGRFFLRGAGNTEPLGTDRDDRRVEILILD